MLEAGLAQVAAGIRQQGMAELGVGARPVAQQKFCKDGRQSSAVGGRQTAVTMLGCWLPQRQQQRQRQTTGAAALE